jgi:sRNA-binding protein
MLTLPAPKAVVTGGSNSVSFNSRQRRRDRLCRAACEHLLPLLRERFPSAFCLPPVPLACSIKWQIIEVAGDSIDRGELATCLAYWMRRKSYLEAIWRGDARRNLDGLFAGYPFLKERNAAGEAIWGERYRRIEDEAAADQRRAFNPALP